MKQLVYSSVMVMKFLMPLQITLFTEYLATLCAGKFQCVVQVFCSLVCIQVLLLSKLGRTLITLK